MDLARVEAEFRKLRGQYEAGGLSEAEFKAQLENLMLQDEQGRWWMIGYETGQWHYHDGEKWVRGEPAQPAIPVPPVEKRIKTQRVPTLGGNKLLWVGGIVAVLALVVILGQLGGHEGLPTPTSTPTTPPRSMEPTATLPSVALVPTKTLVPPVTVERTAAATDSAAAQATQAIASRETETAVAHVISTAIAAGIARAAETASVQATGTAAVHMTSTAVAAGTATALAVAARPTNTRTPSPYEYPAPKLLAPAKGAVFTGYVAMDFDWQPVTPQLAADEYYALVITFLHRDGHRYPYLQASTKDTRWQGQLSAFLYESDVLADRGSGWQHGWYVVVMRKPGMNEKGQITGTQVSPLSEERGFTWKLEGGGGGPGVGPTPTRTPKV